MKTMRSGSGRRSRQECLALAREFEGSGLTRREYGRRVGLAPASLDYYRRLADGSQAVTRLVEVEVAPPAPAAGVRDLAVVLGDGRRIEVGRGFDEGTLWRLLRTLEAGR